MRRFLIFLMVIQFILAGCSLEKNIKGSAEEDTTTTSREFKSYSSQEEETTNDKFTTVTSDQVKELIQQGNIVIIDVRKEESFIKGHIQNAQNIPLIELEDNQAEMDKNATYLMVCKTGKTSEEACKLLAKNGFDSLLNLSGGMDVWTGEIVN